MFLAINVSLIEAISMIDSMSEAKIDKATLRRNKMQEHMKPHYYIMNADVRGMCGVSMATANRILSGLVTDTKLYKYYKDGHWVYELLF